MRPAASALFVAQRSKVILALLLIVGVIPAWAQNGTGGPQPPSCTPTAPAGSQQTEDRPVSLKLVVPNILQDQKPIWTFPAKAVKGEHWKPMLGIAGATAGLVALDTIDAPYFRRTGAFNQFNKNFSGTNMGVGTAVVPLSFYAISLVRKNTYGRHTSLLAGEAAADAEILTTVMKHVDRRLRPSGLSPYGDFDDTWFRAPETLSSGQSSFPSGHAIAAFAVAAVFADRYRNHRWAPWVAYGLAGLSRLFAHYTIGPLPVRRLCGRRAWLSHQPLCRTTQPLTRVRKRTRSRRPKVLGRPPERAWGRRSQLRAHRNYAAEKGKAAVRAIRLICLQMLVLVSLRS